MAIFAIALAATAGAGLLIGLDIIDVPATPATAFALMAPALAVLALAWIVNGAKNALSAMADCSV